MSQCLELSDLPPRYLEHAMRQIQESLKRKTKQKEEKETQKEKSSEKEENKPKMKYRSHETASENGINFKSKKEEKRYHELMELFTTGDITELKLQPQFTLVEGYMKPDGTRVRRMRYTADFSYKKDGKLIVEDVKSHPTKTTDYQMRKNLMKDIYGIVITEVM